MSDANVHFIVGMSRAGTAWMMKGLNPPPNVVALGETAFWGRRFLEPANGHALNGEEAKETVNRASAPPTSLRPTPNGQFRGMYRQLNAENFSHEVNDELTRSPPVTPRDAFDAIVRVATRLENKSTFIEKTPHHINWISRIRDNYPGAKFIIMMRDPYHFMLSYKHQGERQQGSHRQEFRSLYHPVGCSLILRG